MPRNYSPSQIEAAETQVNGVRVDTSILVCTTTIFKQSNVTLFNVYGRIRIGLLCGEVTTVFSADAAKGRFCFASTSPVIASANMSADSAVVTSMAVGQRLTLQGDLVGTAAVITASAGISFWPLGMMIVGTNGGTGVISINNDGAAVSVATGAMYFSLCYTPVSDDAYASAAV
jgi:hypothetical protein